MSKTYRVGVIGFAHMHINSLIKQFGETCPGGASRLCRYDAQPARSARCPLYPRLECTECSREYGHAQSSRRLWTIAGPRRAGYCPLLLGKMPAIAEVVDACAARDVHVVVEKPMASSLAHGLRMARACQAAGTTLLINWPTTWSTAIRATKQVIDDGNYRPGVGSQVAGRSPGPIGIGRQPSGRNGRSHAHERRGTRRDLVASKSHRRRGHVGLLLLWL